MKNAIKQDIKKALVAGDLYDALVAATKAAVSWARDEWMTEPNDYISSNQVIIVVKAATCEALVDAVPDPVQFAEIVGAWARKIIKGEMALSDMTGSAISTDFQRRKGWVS